MLSGIGPKDQLNSLNIDLIEDLPVGYNLHDHISMSALTFLVNESVTIVEPRLVSNLANTVDYFVKGDGPLTIPGGAEALAFVNTQQDRSKDRKENLQPDKRTLFYGKKQFRGRNINKRGNVDFHGQVKVSSVATNR